MAMLIFDFASEVLVFDFASEVLGWQCMVICALGG